MTNPIVSLAFYVSRAKRTGATVDELKAGEYEEVLAEKVDFTKAAELWEEMDEGRPLISLADIDLSQTDYLDIVDQVYNGTPFRDVRISAVDVPSAVVPTHAPYFQKYLEGLQSQDGDTRTGPAVEATMSRLNECLANNAVASAHANGLVMGRVQSGKTRNYVGLMLKAADDGWNVIIVLTSSNRALARQTQTRIEEEFTAVGAHDPRHSMKLDFLSADAANRLAGDELDGDFFYWGLAMKQVDGLERIRQWLTMTNQPLGKMRVMIIDDEADNATPDSNQSGPQNLGEDEIEARIKVIRREEPVLADWLESLSEREWPEAGENTPEAAVFQSLHQKLTAPQPQQQQQAIVNSAEYRRFLGMDDFSEPPVEEAIERFFSGGRGINNDHSSSAFCLLLRSILDVTRGRSAINAAVCSFVGPNPRTGTYTYPFARCAYLGYTATPYANILNEGPNQTPIYADFIQSLEIAPQYFGADEIFGHDIATVKTRMPIVGAITDDEESRILDMIRLTANPLLVDENLLCHDENGELEWKSLKDAVAWAFCTAAARKYLRIRDNVAETGKKSISRRWTTMLVNVDQHQAIHETMRHVLVNYIGAHCDTPAARADFETHCRAVWNTQTARFTAGKFEKLFNANEDAAQNYGPFEDYPAWEDIRGPLMDVFENWRRCVHVVILNSTTVGIENQAVYAQNADLLPRPGPVKELTGDHLWFVSGGNTISRGLTLFGLTASYFDRVRDSTCVDTLTQMGRWFGYRKGYELLPRLWMQADAVGEMKRIAQTELKLHESIADNFKQGFSPSDPAHFQQITSWSRQLSGRAYAARVLDSNIGTTGSADDYWGDGERRRRVFDTCSAFVEDLGAGSTRDPAFYTYAATPLWEDVDRNKVRAFLVNLLAWVPDRSARLIRGLTRDISASEPLNWDIVLGHPKYMAGEIDFAGHRVRFGSPEAVNIGGGILRTSAARLHRSFYAMIRLEHIIREDVALLVKNRVTVAKALEQKAVQNNGTLPSHYDAALPGPSDAPIPSRLDSLIQRLQKADGAEPLPDAIHARLDDVSKGLRNQSSAEYMANVHRRANHRRPTLQLYLIRPKREADGLPPLVNISFYWPDHDPVAFFSVAVDGNPDFVRSVTPGVFCQTVEDILRERNFPVQRKELLRLVLERLDLRCTQTFFDQHIAHPLRGYNYRKMTGRNAYCIDGWAEDEEAKLKKEFLRAAVGILQRDSHRSYSTEELMNQVIAEDARLRDFFVPNQSNDKSMFNNELMTDEVMAANGIVRLPGRPVAYQASALAGM